MAKKSVMYTEAEINKAKNLSLVIREGSLSASELKKREKILKFFGILIIYAFLALMAIVVLVPFYWMIITSLKTNSEIRDELTFFPQTIQWANYTVLFEGAAVGEFEKNTSVIRAFPFWTYLANTLIVGVISTAGTLITTIFAAFAFSRLNFKGKDLLFTIFLGTMMIPGEMMVITNYLTVAKMGLLESKAGAITSMIIPFWVSVFYIFQLRQNFKQIPNELYLAAKVDGTTDFGYLCKVMIPLSLPTLISITILKMMGAWNSYVWPRLVANDPAHQLITNGLRNAFADSTGEVDYPVQMAAVALVSIPLFLVFLFFRKYIMKGVSRSGIKG